MSRRGFICAGCWTVDRIKLIDTWPVEEGLSRITDVDQLGGGSAHNVGIDLRLLDPSLPVATIGCVGDDEDGDFLFSQAQRYQLDTTQLIRSHLRATSYTDVMSVAHSGKRTFFHYTGANDLLCPDHFDFSHSQARILHLGLLSLHAGLDAPRANGDNGWSVVLANARANGLKTSIEMVSIDPTTNRKLVVPCLPHLDYLIVNDNEIGAIANIQTVDAGQTNVERCLQAARVVMAQGSMTLLAVHYPKGAICLDSHGHELITQSLTVPQHLIASSVGAGDAFVAGLLYGVHENWPINESLQLAHITAAASLRSMTTVGSVQSIEQCREFADQLNCE